MYPKSLQTLRGKIIIRSVYSMLIRSCWHCWELVPQSQPSEQGSHVGKEEKGSAKGKYFLLSHSKPGPGWPIRSGQEPVSGMAVVITIIQEIIVMGKTPVCSGFLSCPSRRGEGARCCHGGIPLAATGFSRFWESRLGKPNFFCHFNVSLCCLKSQLRPSPLRHVERRGAGCCGCRRLEKSPDF